MDISGRTALVTGAASGIGLGIATALVEAGANVVMADVRKAEVEQAAHNLAAANRNVLPIRTDVTQEASILDALAQTEKKFGKLHIACNNAGIPFHGTRLVDTTPEEWDFVIAVNIRGTILGIRHFVPAILRHGEPGHIVNTASLGGFRVPRGLSAGPYCMSKYAVVALSEALESELEGTNVGVTLLCPGPFNTGIAHGARNRPDHMGGPLVRAAEESLLGGLATTGRDPREAGDRVLAAIRAKQFYAFIGAEGAEIIAARHRRIEAALTSPWTTRE